MKKYFLIAILLLLSSCKSTQLLPSSYDESVTAFNSYEEAMSAYDKINAYDTSKGELKLLGFDVNEGRNVEVLTYLDVSKKFMHNPAITLERIQNENYKNSKSKIKKEIFL